MELRSSFATSPTAGACCCSRCSSWRPSLGAAAGRAASLSRAGRHPLQARRQEGLSHGGARQAGDRACRGRRIDQPTGQMTTGHEWDGIKELNTPLPRWWLWTFYASIAFALLWVVLYPAHAAHPLGDARRARLFDARRSREGDGRRQGRAGRQPRARRDAVARRHRRRSGADALRRRRRALGVPGELRAVPRLRRGRARRAIPTSTTTTGCGAERSTTSTPRSRTASAIAQDPDTRISQMPAFGADGILDAGQIDAAANFVLSLSGEEHDATLAATGKTDLRRQLRRLPWRDRRRQPRARRAGAERCDLALRQATARASSRRSRRPRHGVMPAWAARLDPTTIKELALYVHSLGGGEAEVAAKQRGTAPEGAGARRRAAFGIRLRAFVLVRWLT